MDLMNMMNVLACQIGNSGQSIPKEITDITSLLYTVIKIAIPLILIIYGMFDFGKSVMAGKEDEIKTNQKLFIKRLISAALVFLLLSFVEIVIGIVTSVNEKNDIMRTVKCILTGK